MSKALLFLNGKPPKKLPQTAGYRLIACTDGALHYLKEKKFPLDKLDFISGDFDSHSGKDEDLYAEKFICTPDQDKTDFQKALEILAGKGAATVHVYGGSGKEMDHFLGNLTVMLKYKDRLKMKFFDDYSEYFFADNDQVLIAVQGRMISLYPFPGAENIITNGLNWELCGEDLNMAGSISTRNFAVKDNVHLRFSAGNLLVFIGEIYKNR